jgi:hypothetical protein
MLIKQYSLNLRNYHGYNQDKIEHLWNKTSHGKELLKTFFILIRIRLYSYYFGKK